MKKCLTFLLVLLFPLMLFGGDLHYYGNIVADSTLKGDSLYVADKANIHIIDTNEPFSIKVGGTEAMRIIESGDDITINFYLTVDDVTISDGGLTYSAGDLVFTGGGGSGAAGTYTVDGSGTIDATTMTSAGSGYTSVPTVAPSHAGDGNADLDVVVRTFQLILPQEESVNAPTLAFGNGTTGFHLYTDNQLRLSIKKSNKWLFSSTSMGAVSAGGGMIKRISSATIPAVTFTSDDNTGKGHANEDQSSEIAGDIEANRFSEGNAYVSSITGHNVVEVVTDASTANGAATLTKAGEGFDGTCSVGDAVLVYGGTTEADYGTYIITEVTSATVLTVDRNFGGSNADVDFDVLADGVIIENATDVTNHKARLRVPENAYIGGILSAAFYGSGGEISDAELLFIDGLGSNAQNQLDARCLESVFGETVGAGLTKDGTVLKASTALQSITGLTVTAGDIIVATGGDAYNKLDHGAAGYTLVGAGAANPVWTAPAYAGMYLDNNGNAITISTAGYPVMMRHFTQGALEGFTFDAGRQVDADILNEIDDTQLKIETSAAHNLTTGDVVSHTGMNNAAHNGVTAVTVVDGTNYTCDDIAYVAGAGASTGIVEEGSHLIVSAGSAGLYVVSFNVSATEGGGGGSTFIGVIYINSTSDDKSIGKRKYVANDFGNLPGHGILTLAENEKVYLTVESSGTNDFTAHFGNVILHKP